MMRKYCRACGAPLIKLEEESTLEPVDEVEETPIEETASLPEEESFVRPSDVASQQAELDSAETEPVEVAEEPPTPESEKEDSESGIIDDERGREVIADIMEKVNAAEARSRSEEVTDTEIEPPPAEPVCGRRTPPSRSIYASSIKPEGVSLKAEIGQFVRDVVGVFHSPFHLLIPPDLTPDLQTVQHSS